MVWQVTYRSLSRALKVHSHSAKRYVSLYRLDIENALYSPCREKRMLYDFHQNENSKKPNSVNATYVITGVRQLEAPAANGKANDDGDGDDFMQSSPYISSSMPNQDDPAEMVPTVSIILVREEDLEGTHLDIMLH